MWGFEFDCALEKAFGLLTDPDFVVERSLAPGDLESRCKVDLDYLVASLERIEHTKDDSVV